MALTLGGALSDRINIGTTSVTPDGCTVLCWVNLTTLTTTRYFYGSLGALSNNNVINFRLSGTSGNVSVFVRRASNTTYTTSDTPATLNTWVFLAFTFDSAASPNTHIYHGTLTALASESTYGTTTAGSGALNSQSAGANLWGNDNSISFSMQGAIAWGQTYNRVLTLAQIQSLQFRRTPLSGCTNYIEFGFNGVGTQPDWSGSGNAGTVTGATLSVQHIPLGPQFGFGSPVPYVVAAAAIGSTSQYLSLLGCGS